MVQWWHESGAEIVNEKLTREIVKKAVALYYDNQQICLRNRTPELIQLLCDMDIPLLVFSAGITVYSV